MITVVDCGLGNIHSIVNMLKRAGHSATLSGDPGQVEAADKLILPGVGAFDAGVASIEALGLRAPLEKQAAKGTPILGICLGMELMLERSEEGSQSGLGWIRGSCVRFAFGKTQRDLKVPHMRWNAAVKTRESVLFADMDEDAAFYFVHSYHVVCDEVGDVAARTTHGVEFASAVQRKNLFGTQFHPEKSHKHGMRVLKNFAEL